MMDEVQKSCNPECYTPSSKPFRIKLENRNKKYLFVIGNPVP
jgi:hypothetical protein